MPRGGTPIELQIFKERYSEGSFTRRKCRLTQTAIEENSDLEDRNDANDLDYPKGVSPPVIFSHYLRPRAKAGSGSSNYPLSLINYPLNCDAITSIIQWIVVSE